MKCSSNTWMSLAAVTIVVLTAPAASLANTVKEAAVSAGAASSTNGSLLNAGQHAIGNATSTTHGMKAGIIPLIVGGEVGVSIAAPVIADAPHDRLKNRYISIKPHGANGDNFGMDFDIRLTMTSTLVNGVAAVGSQWWAGAPDAECIAVVSSTPPAVAPNWDDCRTVHLTGCAVIPTSEYDVVAIVASSESGPLAAQTQERPGARWWGDVVGFFDTDVAPNAWTGPNNTVNIDDALAGVKTFIDPDGINATHVSVTDLEPHGFPGTPFGEPNKTVNLNDVLGIILGFQGTEFPGPALEMCP